MIATETETTDLNRFYEAAIALTGNPPEYALFDPQLAGALNREWLIERAQIEEGVERAEVEAMLAEGLIRVWTDGAGARNTSTAARTIRNLARSRNS